MKQTLKFVGRGSAFNKTEPNNCAFYKKDGILFIIDCGEGALEGLVKAKAFDKVKHVYQIITHMHNDHVAELGKTFAYCNQVLGIKPNLINSLSIDLKKLAKHGIKEDKDFKRVEPIVNNYKWVNFLLVPHAKNMDSCALELYLDGKKIFYSGDCSNIPFAIDGYDEYYLDCSESKNPLHMDIARIKQIIEKNKIKKQRVFLMHIESARTLALASQNELNVVETVMENGRVKTVVKKKPLSQTKEGSKEK